MSKSECQRQSNWKVNFKKITYLKPSDVIFGREMVCYKLTWYRIVV